MWHVTHDKLHATHGGGWSFSQNFSSLTLTFLDRQCLEDSEQKDHLLNESQRFLKNSPSYTGSVNNTSFKSFGQGLNPLNTVLDTIKPAAQAAGADPSLRNSTNRLNPPIQQNGPNFWTDEAIVMSFKN